MSINLKGGTAVLIDKTSINEIIHNIEKSFNVRITLFKFTVNGKNMLVLNINIIKQNIHIFVNQVL